MRPLTVALLLVGLAALGGCGIFDIFACETPMQKLIDTLGTDHPAETELIARGAEAIEPLSEVLKTGDVLPRRRAAGVIAAIAPALPAATAGEAIKEATASLGGALADADVDVVIGALRGLGELRAAAQVEAIGDVMLKNPDLAVKGTAAEALGRIGSPSAAVLMRIARDKADPVYCRVMATRALAGVASSDEVVSALIEILNETGHVPLRDAAVEALATIAERDPSHLGAVVAQLATPDACVRISFAAVIARLGPCFFAWSDTARDRPDVYNRLISDPYAPIRAVAVRSLVRTYLFVKRGDTLHPYSLPEDDLAVVRGRVAAMLSSESEPTALAAAAWAAGRLGVEVAVDRLIELLGHPDAGVRYSAVAALRSLTGQWFDYQPLAPEAARNEAVAKWKQWRAAGAPQN